MQDKRKLQGSVVRKVDSAIHWIVIFSTVVVIDESYLTHN